MSTTARALTLAANALLASLRHGATGPGTPVHPTRPARESAKGPADETMPPKSGEVEATMPPDLSEAHRVIWCGATDCHRGRVISPQLAAARLRERFGIACAVDEVLQALVDESLAEWQTPSGPAVRGRQLSLPFAPRDVAAYLASTPPLPLAA